MECKKLIAVKLSDLKPVVESRVYLDKKNDCICFDTGSYEYWIACSRCNTMVKILHWVKHLSMKTWMTGPMIERFICLAATEKQLELIHRGVR